MKETVDVPDARKRGSKFTLDVKKVFLEYYRARGSSFVDKPTEGCLAITLNKALEVNSETHK